MWKNLRDVQRCHCLRVALYWFLTLAPKRIYPSHTHECTHFFRENRCTNRYHPSIKISYISFWNIRYISSKANADLFHQLYTDVSIATKLGKASAQCSIQASNSQISPTRSAQFKVRNCLLRIWWLWKAAIV